MQQDKQMTDIEIISRILNGEKLLYELIVRRYNTYLYRVGRSYNFNHEDTQDLMQDTYIDAFKGLPQFEQRASFKTWIIRIMTNNCYHKKQKSSVKHEFTQENINENLRPMFNNSISNSEQQIHNRELGRLIEKALEKIPEEYRTTFSLREISGLSVAETADLLNISQSNVKVRLNRAKAMLRRQIENLYLPSELYDFNLIYCDSMVNRVMHEIALL